MNGLERVKIRLRLVSQSNFNKLLYFKHTLYVIGVYNKEEVEGGNFGIEIFSLLYFRARL